MAAIVVVTLGSLPLAFLHSGNQRAVYVLSGIQGVGLLIMLNTATSLISDVIADDTDHSAFVYGAYSFLDKVANGLLLFYMVENYSNNPEALKWIMALTPIICTVLAYILNVIGANYSRY